MYNNLAPNHPINIYDQEKNHLIQIIQDIENLDINTQTQEFFNLFNQFAQIKKRFSRKENQLFPYLEKHGWKAPSMGMWSFHDTLRSQIDLIYSCYERNEFTQINQSLPLLFEGVKRLFDRENSILFPNALNIISASEWIEITNGEQEIGWAYPHKITKKYNIHETIIEEKVSNKLKMNEGWLNLEQVNLMLQTLPFDITYVDENDRVLFYNRGEERVFPRSPGIIGREVKFCHPPKSVNTVLSILEEFKSGSESNADFWFNHRGKMLFIRYFAIRNHLNEYKGVLEVSQEVNHIQNLKGEQRLLTWGK
ncbi:PAS domain-containing protein [Aureibacter tunicatorum]|nr:PAS domain-containing protein [Aureibacter tunicatorum]